MTISPDHCRAVSKMKQVPVPNWLRCSWHSDRSRSSCLKVQGRRRGLRPIARHQQRYISQHTMTICPDGTLILYSGSFSEYVKSTEAYIALKPKSLSFAEAASLPLAAVTALQALRRYRGSLEGKTVFVPGGCKLFGIASSGCIGKDMADQQCSKRNRHVRVSTSKECLPCRQGHHHSLNRQSPQSIRATRRRRCRRK